MGVGQVTTIGPVADQIKDFSSLSSYLSAVGSASKTLIISTEVPVTSNITIPANVSVVVQFPGKFTVSVGATLTVSGPFQCGPFQCFYGPGSSLLSSFGEPVNVKWFGAGGDNVIDDTAAIQTAIDSIVEGRVILPAGDYKISDTIRISKNNIELFGLSTATLDVEDTAVLSDGVAIQAYSNTTTQPVNVRLENINIIVRTANGVGGIRWGASYSSMRNVNVRIIGDNLTGVLLTCDDAGSGPYYDKLEQVFVQGNSNSVTPLTGTIGFDFVPSVATPSRSPNANTLTKCRVGGCYKGYRVRGQGHLFDGCVGESINQYHLEFDHPSVASGSSYNTVIEYYAEHYNTATLCYCGTRSSGIMLINPFYTGTGTVFTDNSPSKNCRALLPADIPPHTTPYVRAAANVTGTTINSGFNANTVTTSATGVFRLNFETQLSTANYFVSAIPSGSDLGVRISGLNVAYVQLDFFNTVTGAAANPTGFTVSVSR